MKLIKIVTVLAVTLSICYGIIYLKFFSNIDSSIVGYVVQVGVYKDDSNANTMMEQLNNIGKTNYKYQKDNTFIVITGVFLKEEEAVTMGKEISESGITCVVKPTEFASNSKEVISAQNYEAIISELSS